VPGETRNVATESRPRAAEGSVFTPDPRCLLDIPAAAARLGVTQRWVRRAVAERRISFVKVGRNVRFEPEAISRYIERQRRPARDEAR
jgi:excisionase family DNA binding protein